MRPLIGIPPCLDERGRWKPGRSYHYVDAAYARALDEVGGQPVYVPDHGSADGWVRRLDGLLLPGGDDLAPDRPYPRSVQFDLVSPRQLAFDRALLDAALARQLPVLGICYGMQLLALASGGTLHFDLPTDCPDAGPHQLPEADGRHALEWIGDSALGRVLDGAAPHVNSLHHQAIADPGEASVAARADDGVIEAIERAGPGFAIGVQWHPEKLEAPHRARLFGALVEAARRPA